MTFEGFPLPTKNFFSMPNAVTDIIAAITNMAELKVLIYVIRHTWGFHEYGKPKAISVDEFMHGRRLANGTRMDSGTGLSHHSVIDGCKRAVDHGYLLCEVDDSDLARVKKSYALKMMSARELSAPGANSSGGEEFAPGAESSKSSAESASRGAESSEPMEDSAPRSEKDTLERHFRKTLLERQCGELSESAITTKEEANASHATPSEDEKENQATRSEPKRPPSEPSQSERAVLRFCTEATTLSGQPVPERPRTTATRAQATRLAVVPPKELPATQKSKPSSSLEIATLTKGGQQVTDAWASLFKSPPRIGPKTVECANDLAPRLAPWCDEFSCTLAHLLKEQRDWLYASDPEYYRRRGVTLCDIGREFERWQDVKQEALAHPDAPVEIPRARPVRRDLPRPAPKDPGTVMWQGRLMTYAEADEHGWNGGFGEFIQHEYPTRKEKISV